MIVFVIKRLLYLIPVLIGVSIIAFALMRLVPGDPVVAMAGLEADQQTIEILREKYGLDRPLIQQYLIWAGHILQGDFGRSIRAQRPVSQVLIPAIGPTVQLAVAALILSVFIAIPTAVISATRKNSITDYTASLFALAGLSVPSFWLGIMLILYFSIELRLLPSSGYVSVFSDFGEGMRHLILPTITLGTALAAATMRMTRATMLETLQQDYVRTARAKGATQRTVIYRHVLGNALIPVLTLIGIQMGQLLGGVVVTETVFVYPGLGRLVVDAIFARDYPVIQAVTLIMAVTFVVINLVIDLSYTLVDPRIRY
jgi:peptide/nickel transport system permease protein